MDLLNNNLLNKNILNKENNFLKLNLCKLIYKQIIISIKSYKNIKLIIDDTNIYNLFSNFNYNIVYNFKLEKTDINLQIHDLYNSNIDIIDIDYIIIQEYGLPTQLNNFNYNICYSFDSKYMVGAFASIYSLLINFNQDLLKDLNINIIISEKDLEELQTNLFSLLNSIKNIYFSIYIINNDILHPEIYKTSCFKGGNHLLNLSNYSRLIIGHLILCKIILYLDADTIIQNNLSDIMDKIDNDFIIKGKMSDLNYNNIFNANNDSEYRNILDFNKNIIYTGTLIINPLRFKLYFEKIINVVKDHNKLLHKGGLYKLFTMSLINIGLYGNINYFDDILINVVDLGYKIDLHKKIEKADVLDWSGIFKPWFKNGLYQEYWKKYNKLDYISSSVENNKNIIEKIKI